MIVKKAGGKIFGASFTAGEQKAIDLEIGRQLAEANRKNLTEIDALVLYILRTEYGFGVKRLREFFDKFGEAFDAVNERYELGLGGEAFVATQKLKEYGIDLEAWEAEKIAKISKNDC